MTDLQTLEKRINELEERMKKLEGENVFMDALYEKAKELVIKHNKASILFLQKKLMIDYQRASDLLDKLHKNGII